jgi:hypothetical protein
VEVNSHAGLNRQKVYEEEFERQFLQETKSYFASEADRILTSCPLDEYIKFVQNRISEETTTTDYITMSVATDKVRSVLENCFISHKIDILQEYFKGVLDSQNIEACRAIYDILVRIPFGTAVPLDQYQSHVTTSFLKLTSSMPGNIQKDPSKFLDLIIQNRNWQLKYCKEAFLSDPTFIAAVDKV